MMKGMVFADRYKLADFIGQGGDVGHFVGREHFGAGYRWRAGCCLVGCLCRLALLGCLARYLAGGVAVVIFRCDAAGRHERIAAGVCERRAVALRVVLCGWHMQLAGREGFARFVDEYRFYDHAVFAFVGLLQQGDAVFVQGIDHGFDAGREVGVFAAEVRVAAGFESRAESALGFNDCGCDVLHVAPLLRYRGHQDYLGLGCCGLLAAGDCIVVVHAADDPVGDEDQEKHGGRLEAFGQAAALKARKAVATGGGVEVDH